MRDHCYINWRWSSMLLLSTIAVIDFFAVFVTAESTAVVNTSTGPVQGVILTSVNSVNYAAFKGIPYAKPPLGYLRFQPPVAIDPWTETLNATVDGNDCIQFNFFNRNVSGSEDCLFINVHTPVTDLAETPMELKPVMVWIHGGGFTTGSSSSAIYQPDYLLEKGVVYVSFNYRLGALGFMTLNHRNATGNAGLKDQVLALKWVKANIAKFGGNSNNVTIFGHSAGSASVGYHVLSDASTGLFQGAISMSGVPLNPWAFNNRKEAVSHTYKLAELLGSTSRNKTVLLQIFCNVPAYQIADLSTQMHAVNLKHIYPFVPTLEDKTIATDVFLTDGFLDKYKTGNFTKVPQMLGYTDHETVSFFNPIFQRLINEITKPGESELNVRDLTTRALFTTSIDTTQKMLAMENDGKPVYYYHVSFYTNTSLHIINRESTLVGAGHGDDLAYIFYFSKALYSTDPMDPTRRTIDRVSAMWTNFAKYGNPTPSWVVNSLPNFTWPDSELMGRSLDIGTELKVG